MITDVGTIEARLCVFDFHERKLLPGGVPLQVLPGTVQVGRARFTNEGIESFGFSPDGKRATVSVVDWLSGLTIAEGA